ncbi:hypothetical protein T07_13154 [Trichinella nelsoni]|uniref:Uncharacterized protein n=1 Tax=Trichinella nelsoni TaxID=6336 RepID=A0A0V0SHR1_9BILA|nr:hypothetical protein T07_13154 [Trichinella nelsoni]
MISVVSIDQTNSRARIDGIFKRNVYPIFKNSQQRIRLPVFPLPVGSVFQRQTAYEQPKLFFKSDIFTFQDWDLNRTLNFAFDKDKNGNIKKQEISAIGFNFEI